MAWSGRRDHDQREVDEVRATRDLLPRLWAATTPDAVEIINSMLADAARCPTCPSTTVSTGTFTRPRPMHPSPSASASRSRWR